MAMNHSAMDALKGILGDDADQKIQAVMSSLSGGAGAAGQDEENPDNIGEIASAPQDFGGSAVNDLVQIKALIDHLGSSRNDPRSNLLMSLRPYMRSNRQRSIDSAVKMLNLTKLSGLFKM